MERYEKCPKCGGVYVTRTAYRTADAGPNAPAVEEMRQSCGDCGWALNEVWNRRQLVSRIETFGRG